MIWLLEMLHSLLINWSVWKAVEFIFLKMYWGNGKWLHLYSTIFTVCLSFAHTSKARRCPKGTIFGVLSKVCMERSVCLYLSCIITLDSLVTAVPFPLVSGLHREEVCCPLVLYSLWEPQQDSVVEVPHTWMIRRPEGKGNRKWMSQVYLEQLHCEPKWHKENLSLWLGFYLYPLLVGGIFTSHHPLHTEIFFLIDHFT